MDAERAIIKENRGQYCGFLFLSIFGYFHIQKKGESCTYILQTHAPAGDDCRE
jgi:hypothetical protein